MNQRGMAVIAAILVAALAAAVAAALLADLGRWTDSVRLERDQRQAAELTHAGLDFARALLQDDARRGAIDHRGETWRQQLPPLPAEGGEVSGRIDDRQGRWNLNNLLTPDGRVDATALTTYRRLLMLLGLPAQLADTLADWLDSDEERRINGAESADYQLAVPPHGAANRPLQRLAGLDRVKGYDPATLRRLAPFVTVLPEVQPINVNLAPAEVLAAVHTELDLRIARQLVESARHTPFRDVADFAQRLALLSADAAVPPATATLSVDSRFFEVSLRSRYGPTASTLRALVRRNGSAVPDVLWQDSEDLFSIAAEVGPA